MCRRILKLVGLFLFVCCFSVFSAKAEVAIRTTQWVNDTICVAFDFRLSKHEKISSEPGGLDILLHNAEILDKKALADNQSAVYKIRKISADKPLTYDVFYVVCGDTCEPRSVAGEIIQNELLSESEVAKIFEAHENYNPLAYLILIAFIVGLVLNLIACVF